MSQWTHKLGWAILLLLAPQAFGQLPDARWGLGVRLGAARLEGDAQRPRFNPVFSGVLSFVANPNLSLAGELGYSKLTLDDTPGFASQIVPIEAEAVFRLLPYRRATPFASLGGGGVWWRASQGGRAIVLPSTGKKQEGFDSFLKTSGGLDISLSRYMTLSLGATFRYSLSDALDQIFAGDEKDAVISLYSGLTLYLNTRDGDRDRDGVLDTWDLDSRMAEDRDGYLDHDGAPEDDSPGSLATVALITPSEDAAGVAPVVIHQPRRWAEAGKPLKLQAEVFAPGLLERVALLYREHGMEQWLVAPVETGPGDTYHAVVPSEAVQEQGVEYCFVAVDQTRQGLGYSGLPSWPNFVQVVRGQAVWRAATTMAAIVGWGTASYVVFRGQK